MYSFFAASAGAGTTPLPMHWLARDGARDGVVPTPVNTLCYCCEVFCDVCIARSR